MYELTGHSSPSTLAALQVGANQEQDRLNSTNVALLSLATGLYCRVHVIELSLSQVLRAIELSSSSLPSGSYLSSTGVNTGRVALASHGTALYCTLYGLLEIKLAF